MDPFGDINKYPARVRQENRHKFTSDDGDGGLNPQAISLGNEEELRFRSCDRVDLLPDKSISLTQRPWRKNLDGQHTNQISFLGCTRNLPRRANSFKSTL